MNENLRTAVEKAVIENIEISFGGPPKKTDEEIVRDIANAFKLNWIPGGKITVAVQDGWVVLEGELHWNFQKELAKKSITDIEGVLGVTNNIRVTAHPE